jgi:hypothetical protein
MKYFLLPVLLLAPTPTVRGDSFYTVSNATADSFLASGSVGNPAGTNLSGLNFGSAATLAIAPATSAKGEFNSVLKFNLAGAVNQFNAAYGAGNWHVTGLTLALASNFGVQGVQPNNNIFNTIHAGRFGIDWLSYDAWIEGAGSTGGSPGYPATGAVSFNSISTLYSGAHDPLGTFDYTPPGNNVYAQYALPMDAALVADAEAGGDVSFYFYAADDQVSYLFNAHSFSSNRPELTLSAAPVPEPGSCAIVALAVTLRLLRSPSFRAWS